MNAFGLWGTVSLTANSKSARYCGGVYYKSHRDFLQKVHVTALQQSGRVSGGGFCGQWVAEEGGCPAIHGSGRAGNNVPELRGTSADQTVALYRLRVRGPCVKFLPMAVYVYETIPSREGDPVRSYELRQSMKDAALTKHPETGEPIRRVITGGLGVMTSSKGGPAPRPASGGHCGSGCGCH